MNLTAAYILPSPGLPFDEGPFSLVIESDRITAVEPAEGAQGVSAMAIMPALVNAHDHGYGLPTLAVGAPDDALECWIPGLANRPNTNPELEASVAFGRMALAGIGTSIHCHNSARRDWLEEEAAGVARAAEAVGIRIAFSCPIADRNPLVYGDPGPLIGCGYPQDLLQAREKDFPNAARQIANALATRETYQSDTFNVQLGPIGPQWCQEETLELIAETSRETNMRVHMHLLETERQRQWLDETFDNDPVGWLDRIGLLSPRLTIAHGVWLRDEECEILAERGVTVAVNTSSNLRLRSGIAPTGKFRSAGVAFALGLDGTALDDDQDMLREIRLFKHLQSGMGLEDQMPPGDVYRAVLTAGYGAFDGSNDYGDIKPGARADLVSLDVTDLKNDAINDSIGLTDLVFARATAANVRQLVVAGRTVVDEGALVGFDFSAARKELIASAGRGEANRANPLKVAQRQREAIRSYYRSGHHLRN